MRLLASLPRLVRALLTAELVVATAIALGIPAPNSAPALGAQGLINCPPPNPQLTSSDVSDC
jgi:hypothetical protein